MGTDVHAVFQKETKEGWESVESKWEQNRHYFLFGWLADVRNGVGVGGITTGSALEPITFPRGLPKDIMNKEMDLCYLKVDDYDGSERWLGDHSHSYLSGDEIVAAYDKLLGVSKRGVISLKDYSKWDKVSTPSSYSGGVFGRGITTVNVEVADKLLSGEQERETDVKYFVEVEWTLSNDSVKEELSYFVDEIKRLNKEHGSIRMLFGFDS